MGQALGRAHHVGAGRIERQRGLARPEHHVAAHAGREIDDDVDPGIADAVDHLAIKRHGPRGLAGLGIAHMDMGDGGAGPGGFDRGLRDLPRA